MATTVKPPKGFQTQPQQVSPGAGLSDMFEFFANEAKRKQTRKEINRR